MFQALTSPTERRQLVLHLQHHSLPDVLQQADDLIVAELWQVDAVHWLDVVSYIQLVAPVGRDGFTHTVTLLVSVLAGLLVMLNYQLDSALAPDIIVGFNILNVQTSIIWLVMMNPLIIIKHFQFLHQGIDHL